MNLFVSLYLCIFVSFLFGLSVGSFLNVVSRRLLRGDYHVVLGRSRCEACGKELAWFDLIPLLSFVFLRGRCRYCGAKLSWQYPLVELGTGILFVALFLKQLTINNQQLTIQLLIAHCSLLIASSALIVVFITDFLKQQVFDIVVWFGVVSAFLYRLANPRGLILGNPGSLLADIGLAVGIFLFLWLLRWITRGRGMGEGDPPLGFLTALLVGFPLGIVAFYFAVAFGVAVGVPLVLLGKRKLKERIAFGPFLVAGTFAALFFGDAIWAWYLGVLGL